MRFRPCIDIHNGCVKQIVGSTLKDEGDEARENFVAQADAAAFAEKYASDGLAGGHVIMLNAAASPMYDATKAQALGALKAAPGTLQIGGGITPENASLFLQAGATHVIVTSYVFSEGRFHEDHLRDMILAVGKEHLVLDLSCRRVGDAYRIVTDRWQHFTDVTLDERTLDLLADSCDEFLVHAVDVEGKAKGPEEPLVRLLGSWGRIPVTYAGGISSYADIDIIRRAGDGRLDYTIGSALDLFGGALAYERVKLLK